MIQNRLPNDLLERLETNPFRHPNRYVAWNGHQLLAETVCKRCATVLTALGPDPRLTPRTRELKQTNLRTVIQETFVSRLRTAEFDTIEFEVEEPVEDFVPEAEETRDEEPRRLGVHRSAICRACKAHLLDGVNDLAEVQQLYEADLERMAMEDEVHQLSEASTLVTLSKLATRKVLRILD